MQSIRRKSLRRLLLAGLMAAAMLPALATATPVTFDVNGQFSTPTSGTFGGTMDIDPDVGKVTGVDILFSGFAPFETLTTSFGVVQDSWRIQARNSSRDALLLNFSTPNAPGPIGSLIGFAGGDILRGTMAGPGVVGGPITGFSGTITPAAVAPTPVPEPAALGMFGLGVLLVGGFLSLRRRFG